MQHGLRSKLSIRPPPPPSTDPTSSSSSADTIGHCATSRNRSRSTSRSMPKRVHDLISTTHETVALSSPSVADSSITAEGAQLLPGEDTMPDLPESRRSFMTRMRRSSSLSTLHQMAKRARNSDDHDLPPLTPASTKTSKKHALIRKFTFSRSRRPATSGPSGEEGRWNPRPAHIPAEYLADDSFHVSKGQAGRESASGSRKARSDNRSLGRSADSTADWDSSIDVTTDDGNDADDSFESSSAPRRTDPLTRLPAEVCDLIFSFLDCVALSRAESVCRTWQRQATQNEIWKVVYLRKYHPPTYEKPTAIQMGGLGLGRPGPNGFIKPAPGQNWKKMYQIRKTIERRWLAASPGAIYFQGHTDSVYCCQFDEDKIITGSRDRTIRVWDIHTYQCLKVIGGPASRPILPTQPPHPVEANYTVWEGQNINGTPRGNAIFHEPSDYHSASILCLQYSGTTMVTGSSDTTCIVWDMKEWEPLHRLRHHTGGVLDVCLDDKYIISCSKDSTICVWDRHSGALLKVLRGHRGPVNAVQLRGNLLVSASGDGLAKLWNLDVEGENCCIREFMSQDRGLAAVEFSDDRKWVLAGGNDQVVYKFDANTGNLVHKYEGHTGLVRSLFLDAFDGRVISGSYDQSIRIYDFTTGQLIANYKDWTTSWILSAKADYRRVVCTSQDGRAVLLDFGYRIPDVDLLESQTVPSRRPSNAFGNHA